MTSFQFPARILNTISEYEERVRSDPELEFEFVIKPTDEEQKKGGYKVSSQTFFTTLSKYMEKNDARIIREDHVSLDIIIQNDKKIKEDGNYRVTISEKHFVKKFLKNMQLEDIPTVSIIKKSLEEPVYEDTDFDVNLNLKREKELSLDDAEFSQHLITLDTTKKTLRCKVRTSFQIGNYILDLTRVKQIKDVFKTHSQTDTQYRANTLKALNSEKQKYEIELEFSPNICEFINNENEQSYTTEDILSDLLKCVSSSEILETNTNLKGIKNKYNDLLSISHSVVSPHLSPQVNSLDHYNLKNIITTIESKSKSNKYYIAHKSDGLRQTGFINEQGLLYLYDKHFKKTDIAFKNRQNCILDGEYVTKLYNGTPTTTYIVFDVYFYDGKDVRNEKFSQRKKFIDAVYQDVKQNQNENQVYEIATKNFEELTSLENLHELTEEYLSNLTYENDGLIFTPEDPIVDKSKEKIDANKFVKSNKLKKNLYKWKDSNYHSIDFKVEFNKPVKQIFTVGNDLISKEFQKVLLKSNYPRNHVNKIGRDEFHNFLMTGNVPNKKYRNGNEYKPFESFQPYDVNGNIALIPMVGEKIYCYEEKTKNYTGPEIRNGDIVEFIYDVNKKTQHKWIPIRVRYDKEAPNWHETAESIWKSMHFPLTYEMMTGKEKLPKIKDELETYYDNVKTMDDKAIRNFHRHIVKKELVNQTIGKITDLKNTRVLDLGSGKGGDLPRYLPFIDSGMLQLVGIDISIDNIENKHDGAYSRLIQRLHSKNENEKYLHDQNKSRDHILFLAGDARQDLKDSNSFFGDSKLIVENNGIFEKKFNVVNSMFSVHYMFESDETFNHLINNLDNLIDAGGYFGFVAFDADRIKEELRNTKYKESIEFNNVEGVEILSIKKLYEEKPGKNNIGEKISVKLKSISESYIEEYLINFELLKENLEKKGFKLVKKENFEEIYETQKEYPLNQAEKRISFLNQFVIFQRKK